jgi:GcrA cell cycle regulator
MSHDYPKHRAESFWNEEREAELTRMADEGLGNSEIARRMGVTRNTIIGKRGRMKLPGASPVPRRPVVRVRGARPRALVDLEPDAAEPTPALQENGQPYTIANVPVTGCRYLAGEPTGHVCGHKAAGELGTIAGSYCAWHLGNRIFSKNQPKAA